MEIDIYGIKDDDEYFLNIQKLIKKYSQIALKEPILKKKTRYYEVNHGVIFYCQNQNIKFIFN